MYLLGIVAAIIGCVAGLCAALLRRRRTNIGDAIEWLTTGPWNQHLFTVENFNTQFASFGIHLNADDAPAASDQERTIVAPYWAQGQVLRRLREMQNCYRTVISISDITTVIAVFGAAILLAFGF